MRLAKKVKLHYKLPRHFNNYKPVPAKTLIDVKNFL